MTHTNHRQGTIESLRGDWVIQMIVAKGINDEGASPKLGEFLRLSLRHDPVNAGTSHVGSALAVGWQELIDRVGKAKPSNVMVVFDSSEKVAGFLRDVVQTDLGLSVIVSGLHEETDRICRGLGIRRHTVQHSLGVWGKTELLPHPEILELTTMCGHGMISFNLARRLGEAVRKGEMRPEQAALELARPCICGIFNTRRAANLIREFVALSKEDRKR